MGWGILGCCFFQVELEGNFLVVGYFYHLFCLSFIVCIFVPLDHSSPDI